MMAVKELPIFLRILSPSSESTGLKRTECILPFDAVLLGEIDLWLTCRRNKVLQIRIRTYIVFSKTCHYKLHSK